MEKEIRRIVSPLAIKRAEQEEEGGILEGYFITFNSIAPYGDLGFYEMIAPEAINLDGNREIKCFYNHNYDLILGRENNKTLTLKKDDNGLWGQCLINLKDSQARDIFERVKRGDITGCSFGAYFNDEELISDGGKDVFVVKAADLLEVSVCPFPFYESTTMEARSKLIESRDRKARAMKNKLKFLRRRFERNHGLKKN